MSRSIRHFKGLNHTWSDTKMGKKEKRLLHSMVRAKLKDDFEAFKPIAKKCSKFRGYDGENWNEVSDFDLMNRSRGYDAKRVLHKRHGK